jgi:hypothetical protein
MNHIVDLLCGGMNLKYLSLLDWSKAINSRV